MILTALVVGSLMLHFVISSDIASVEIPLGNEAEVQFQYTADEFIKGVYAMWTDCALGEEEATYRVSITGDGTITKSMILHYLKKNNLDSQLPAEKLIFKRVFAPALLEVKCKDDLLYVGRDYSIILHEQDNRYINCWIDDDDFLQCDTPSGLTGITHVILRVYQDFMLIEEIPITVYVTDRTMFNAQATYITSTTPDENHDGEQQLSIQSGTARTLLRFPNLYGLDATKVASALLILTPEPGTSGQNVSVHMTSAPWHATNTTWNYPWAQPGGDYLSTAAGSGVVTNGTLSIDITALTKLWIQNPDLDEAVLLKTADIPASTGDYSSDLGSAPPILAIYTTP